MSIPKHIHTCWFGGREKPQRLQDCIATQKARLPDYTFTEWTEDNLDLDEYPFLRQAWDEGRYAHLSDMVRLLVIHRHGGIYFDTDVEVVRPLDDLLEADFLCGYMWSCMLGTAVIGGRAGHPILRDLLKPYIETPGVIDFSLPNNHMLTRHFIDEVDGFRLDGEAWSSGGIRVLDRYGFEQPSLLRRKNYTIHHFSATWKNESPAKRRAKAWMIRLMGLYLYRQYICLKSFRNSAMRSEYEGARRAA